MFNKLLVANRGEIAVRVLRTAQAMGIRTVAVYSDADRDALHVRMADEAVRVGPAAVQDSYLNLDKVLDVALAAGAEAVHPGYGLLSENAEFARRVGAAGLVWVGPGPDVIEAMGDKIRARATMLAAGVPVSRGSGEAPRTVEEALDAAASVGYPLMLKAAAGGGGIGMSSVSGPAQLAAAFDQARGRAERMFGSPDLLLERLVSPARHVEVQVVGLAKGRVVALGERDCSVQRRFQKVVEESPAPGLSARTRAALHAAAVAAAEAVGYCGAGTVEFLLDPATEEFVFLEMNTRLQVEHPVTELVTGLDLVELQLRIAAAEDVDLGTVVPEGHALELRLYAEDPHRFLPAPGAIETWNVPDRPWLRVDTGYVAGDEVTRHYDPLVAKICVLGADRAEALARAAEALEEIAVAPLVTNLPFLVEVLAEPGFAAGGYDTALVDRMTR
ncbi:acetyl/propionyl/methylcrotonyl-CoA carboxylase subunit alpha [Nocardioides sp. L-11A]|uniref:acetyl-CoA carboxylase biotin carboxylase subunit n=1 Tax=Nocardioides sp. L-11A TaxID=3043848 RepID=UPI00249CAE5D|nr:biotin carboxylase N-terminal domain-containing protein [Nocardioides sp. L-11A]